MEQVKELRIAKLFRQVSIRYFTKTVYAFMSWMVFGCCIAQLVITILNAAAIEIPH